MTMRPVLPNIASMFRPFLRPSLQLCCQVSLGLVFPVAGLFRGVPFPEAVRSLISLVAALAFVFGYPIRDVAQYAMPFLNQSMDVISLVWTQPMASEWVAMLSFCLFAGVLCAICACGGRFPRIYNTPESAPHKPIPQLLTPTVSGDDRTSGSPCNRGEDEQHWEEAWKRDGLFASTCDAHCILVNGIATNRLNNKARKRPGVEMATLLSSGELYSSGMLANHMATEWVNSQLRSSHRRPYIQDRDARRCHSGNFCRIGANRTLYGTATKRCQLRISMALISMAAAGRRPDPKRGDVPGPTCVTTQSAKSAREAGSGSCRSL